MAVPFDNSLHQLHKNHDILQLTLYLQVWYYVQASIYAFSDLFELVCLEGKYFG